MATQAEDWQETTQDAGRDAATSGVVDRRQHVRIEPGAAHPMSAALADGSAVRLLDLSRGGARFECRARLLPNTTVLLQLITKDAAFQVPACVLRSRVVPFEDGGMGYIVAVAFSQTLPAGGTGLPEPSPAAKENTPDVAPPMVPMTASVDTSSGELRNLLNGNAW